MLRSRRRGLLARTTAVAVLAIGAVLAITGPAQAHNYLIESTPEAGATLTTLPARFSVITNGTLLDLNKNNAGFALQVQDADKRYYGDGCVSVDGPGISTKAEIGAPGVYTVIWQVISTDGHPVSDSFQFTWAPADGSTTRESAGSTKIPDCNGTLHPNAATSAASPGRTASVSEGTLSTILWIGGAVLAVGVAVVVTLLLTARRRKA
ncbi:copper resistance CopC family protein [Lacisediminihabitans changchengi]|uniref:Copper resistance protein CopC n=1 Tax=Lacisediminihabitans changchengi TaxID=2787634 RepID=A0A934VWN7_9MICO|nr:copper resistance CopC family protein [Lacisediminihabitans changchengi]MBK4346007.1 copper resistance protein CopC [Lacisediminihabitans changchengi]